MIKHSSLSSGFTLFEIILAMLIISIAIIPMMQSFAPAMMATAKTEKKLVMSNRARATMERLLALDFDILKSKVDDSQPLTGNDVFGDSEENFTFKETSYAPSITISDASGDGSKTLLDLNITLENTSISTKKADY